MFVQNEKSHRLMYSNRLLRQRYTRSTSQARSFGAIAPTGLSTRRLRSQQNGTVYVGTSSTLSAVTNSGTHGFEQVGFRLQALQDRHPWVQMGRSILGI